MCQSIDIFLLHGIEIIGKISILVSALNSLCCQRRLKSQCLKNFIKEMLSRRCCLLREKYINQGWSVFSVCQQARAVSWWLASFVYSRFPCCTDKLRWAINYFFGQQGASAGWHLYCCSFGHPNVCRRRIGARFMILLVVSLLVVSNSSVV